MAIASKAFAGAALALALGASGAIAQQTAAPNAQPGAPAVAREDGRGPWPRMDPAEMQKRMAERHAERMNKLHDLLAITPNQEGAFKAFADAQIPPRMDRVGDWAQRKKERDAMTTPQRLDDRLARATERYNFEKSRIEATKKFYAQLTPAQKKSFDAASDMMRDRMHEHGRMMRGDRVGGPGMMGGPGGPQPLKN